MLLSDKCLEVIVHIPFLPEYTTLGGDEELPLGEEFQDHLKRFIRAHEKKVVKKFELAQKLVDQLR